MKTLKCKQLFLATMKTFNFELNGAIYCRNQFVKAKSLLGQQSFHCQLLDRKRNKFEQFGLIVCNIFGNL